MLNAKAVISSGRKYGKQITVIIGKEYVINIFSISVYLPFINLNE